MKQKNLIIGIIGILILVIAASGCTSNSNDTSYSSFKTYNNSLMSFEYPESWIIVSESQDDGDVHFNSSNGQIRVAIWDKDNEDYQNYETKTVGNETYRFIEEYNEYIKKTQFTYIIDAKDNKEVTVRGNEEDDEGLKKILETFQLK